MPALRTSVHSSVREQSSSVEASVPLLEGDAQALCFGRARCWLRAASVRWAAWQQYGPWTAWQPNARGA